MLAETSSCRWVSATLAALFIALLLGTHASAARAQEWCAPPPYQCLPPDEVSGGQEYIDNAINGISGGSAQCDSVHGQAVAHANGGGFRFADYGWPAVHWQDHPSVGDIFIDNCELEWDEDECDYDAPMPPGWETYLIIEEIGHHMYGPHDNGGPNDQAINSALNDCFSPGGALQEDVVLWPGMVSNAVPGVHGPHVELALASQVGLASHQEERTASRVQQARRRDQDTTEVLVVAVRRAIAELRVDHPVAIDAGQELFQQRTAVATAMKASVCRGRCVGDGFARVRMQSVRVGERDATVHLSVERLDPTQIRGERFNLVELRLERSTDAVGGWVVTNVRVAEG